jgi:aryl-alcohol dehydrogenase-like predicted oxidoreductase
MLLLSHLTRYRLGRSGLSVSVLSYGAWVSFGAQLGNSTAYDLMKHAYKLGVNFFDNAETYANGEAEVIMGDAIARGLREGVWKRSGMMRPARVCALYRDIMHGCLGADLVVSTKLFWGGNGPNDVGLSRKHIVEGIDASLKRLQLDYVDIVVCVEAACSLACCIQL